MKILRILYCCLVNIGVLIALLTPLPVNASQVVDQAVSDYRVELEQYRRDYQDYVVKKQQHQTADTFASLEALVSSTKKVLLSRADVWQAYFTALRVSLMDQRGIELSERDTLIAEIELQLDLLDAHKTAVSAASTQQVVNEAATAINSKAPMFKALSYRVLMSLSLARNRAVLDQERILAQQLSESAEVQLRDSNIREARLRGFDEIEQTVTDQHRELDGLEGQLPPIAQEGSLGSERTYERFIEQLQPIHTQVRRMFQRITELSTGLSL